jgi:P22 coat protein - gene protein 5
MANKFITPEAVARLAYAHLYDTIVMAGLVFRDYDSDFDGKVGDTITVRKPAVFEADEYNRVTGLKIQKAEEDSFTVKLDKLLDVSFAVTSEDYALELADFNEQLIVPAVEALRQKVDMLLIAQALADFIQEVGAGLGEENEWNDPRSLIDAGVVLDEANVPESDRYSVLGPKTTGAWLKDEITSTANKSGTTAGLRKAEIGDLFGFGTYKSTGIKGPTEANLAFHRSALALVSRTLPVPQGAAKAAAYGADGVGIRAVFDYDMDQKEDIISLDTLVGTKTLDPDRGVIITEGGS